MGHLAQNINLPLASRNELFNSGGLAADPFTGSTNIAVLLFAAAATEEQGAYIVQTNDAAAGTSVTLTQPGVYDVKLYLEQLPSIDLFYGISQDGDAASLVTTPSFANVGMVDVQRSLTVAGQQAALSLSSTILVSPEQEAGSIIRFHAALTGDAAPAGALEQAAAYFRIQRINQLHA